MLLAALLLSIALAPQATEPAQEPAAQPPAAMPAATAPAMATSATSAESPEIAAGLAAFRARHFRTALAEFEKAEAAAPQSAAAAFYLGYTYYKLGEPSKRMNPNKEKAKELFAKAFSLDPAFQPAWH